MTTTAMITRIERYGKSVIMYKNDMTVETYECDLVSEAKALTQSLRLGYNLVDIEEYAD